MRHNLAGGGTRIDRLFRHLEGNAFQVKGKNNVLEVLDASGEGVDPRDGKGVSWSQKVQQQLQFGTPFSASTTGFFCANNFSTGIAQGLRL